MRDGVLKVVRKVGSENRRIAVDMTLSATPPGIKPGPLPGQVEADVGGGNGSVEMAAGEPNQRPCARDDVGPLSRV